MPNRVNVLMARMEVDALKAAQNMIFVDFCGLTAGQVGALRRALREQSLKMRVIRNRMALRALSELGAPDCTGIIDGPTAVIDCECPVTAAKAAMAFAKRNPMLELKGGLIEGEVFDRAAVENLARTGRTKAEWQSTIAGCVLGPFRKLVSCLNVGGQVAGAVKSIVEKGEKDGADSDAA